MNILLEEIKKIETGEQILENRIDGQFVGNRNHIFSFIGKKYSSLNLILFDIFDTDIDILLKENATQVQGRYYYYKEISDQLVMHLKKTNYIQGAYIFNENNCIFHSEDNFEDVTFVIDAC